MNWKLIKDAPTHGRQILVGFQGQSAWFSYVANAFGVQTGQYMPFAPPTHWTEITRPVLESR